MNAVTPSYKLYSPISIAAIAAGGGIFAGALMIALNYRRLGKTDAAWQTLALGMAFGLLVLIVFMYVGTPVSPLAEWSARLTQGAATYFVAQRLLSEEIKKHLSAGGAIANSILEVMAVGTIGIFAFLAATTLAVALAECLRVSLGLDTHSLIRTFFH